MEQGTGIDLHYLSPQEGKIIDVGTSVCTGAGNLPLAGCILMGSLPFLRKKKRYLMASLLFGAGYGNRTRLRGLGSHYNSRYTNPAMCGYYSKWKRKIQLLFVESPLPCGKGLHFQNRRDKQDRPPSSFRYSEVSTSRTL